MNIRVGFGYDMHRFAEGRDLWIGGIKIDYPLGLQGHSDADVLIHAISDALLGAANLRDIGYHFPDTDEKNLNLDSRKILRNTMKILREKGFELSNIDTTICAEQPKMNPYIPAMQRTLASIIGTNRNNISIKATTSEKMGFVGREEGITAYAVALIYKP